MLQVTPSRKPQAFLEVLDLEKSDFTMDGRPYWFFTGAMISTFPGIFEDCEDNYDVERKLRKAKVIRKNNRTDTESCQFWIYFSSQKAGLRFLARLNKFLFEQGWARKVAEVAVAKGNNPYPTAEDLIRVAGILARPRGWNLRRENREDW